jgi:hypothetical protein
MDYGEEDDSAVPAKVVSNEPTYNTGGKSDHQDNANGTTGPASVTASLGTEEKTKKIKPIAHDS